MATDNQVTQAMYDQLNADAAARLKQAGAFWQNRQLGFFYGSSSHSEVSVDLGIKKAVLQLLSDDHATLPSAAFDDLSSSIDTDTVVSAAISKMADVLTNEIFPSDELDES